MLFFRIEGLITEEEREDQNESRRDSCEKAERIAATSELFNQKLSRNAFFFVFDIAKVRIGIGAICRGPEDIRAMLAAFLNTAELDLKDIRVKEVTMHAMGRLLRHADMKDLISDDDEVLELFGLDKLIGNSGLGLGRLEFGENILTEADKAAVYQKAERSLSGNCLVPELDRIYAGKHRKKAAGHPVHYIVRTDDRDTRREMCRVLLQALCANGRLTSRRYSFLDLKPGERFPKADYECLYKSSFGGAVVVRCLANDDTEDDHASCDRETVGLLCDVMKKYRNQVLTVFCLPRGCERMKALFIENLGNSCFVELKEEFASGEKAEDHLRMLARENGIRADKRLFAKLEEGKGYLAPELRELFDEWYDYKLRNSVYPQYRGIATAKREVRKAAPKGSAYEELMEMVGISEAKKVILKALDYYKAQKLFADKGMKTDRPSMHMVFSGNPGTAKTTAARLFAGIMKENGLLPVGRLIEVGRGDLVGKYVGWTAPAIQKKFREAQGSVLFIDEAYSLVDDRDGSYGDEAINTIVQEMENHRDDVVVIFAGYPDKMEGFLQKNPGLRSRIAFHVPFADYSTEELCGIAALIAKKKGLKLTDGAKEKLAGIFDEARTVKDFGNGRYVRNLIEKAKMAQASRLLTMDPELVSRDDVTTVLADDIEATRIAPGTGRRPIGFSAA